MLKFELEDDAIKEGMVIMKTPNDFFIANNAEELLSALEEKESFILIPKHFKNEFLENTQLPVTETEEMGIRFSGNCKLVSYSDFPFYKLA